MQTFEGFPPEPRVRARHRQSADADHYVIGLQVDRQCTQLVGALIAVSGNRLEARYRPLVVHQVSLPQPTCDLFRGLATGEGGATAMAAFATQLAAHHTDMIRRLPSMADVPQDDVLAVGLLGPGIWSGSLREGRRYFELNDPSRLAEECGCNVISNFAQRDLAAGGIGGPLMAVPQWLLLAESGTERLLLDVGRSVRLTLIPGGRSEDNLNRILAFDVGPGTALLDRLSMRLSEGRLPYDPGGTLAVQGTKIHELVDRWLAEPYFQETPPRWQPSGVCAEEALEATVRMAIDSGWAIRDLLCTATHFIARCIATAVESYIPGGLSRIDEVLISGGGQDNGLLLAEIGLQMGPLPLTRIAALGWPRGQLEAATVAVLAGMHLDRVAASCPTVSGAAAPRILGQLTPGSPASWGRLIRYMSSLAPTHLSLRNAI